VHILNYKKIAEYMETVPPPYVLKPRLQAGALGIKKIDSPPQLWEIIEELGDEQSYYVLERFVPGNLYHVDSIVYKGQILLAAVHQYGTPPMQVAHEGRVFTTRTMIQGTDDEKALQAINKELLHSVGLENGVSHTEFIKGHADNRFYFLETSARVGGAHIVELVEASTGLNLWAEWAKIETSSPQKEYALRDHRSDYAGLMISLARQEWPDLSSFNAPEVFWRLTKRHHAGVIVHSPSYDRVTELLNQYTERFYNEFFTSQPLPDKPGESD
jgi:biotin carboxylase